MIPGYSHALLVHWQSRRFGVFTDDCVDFALSVRMSRGFCNDLPVFRVTRRCFQLPLHLCRLIPGIDFPLEFNIFRVSRFERGKLLF